MRTHSFPNLFKSNLISLSLIIILSTFTACSPIVQNSPTPTLQLTEEPQPIAIINGTLIDGNGTDPIKDAALIINGSRISAVGKRTEIAIPAGAKIIDAQGGTILPGFINTHVHYGFDERNLAEWAAGGVTTVRDEGVINGRPLKELLQWRKDISSDPKYARLVSAGQMISVPGGYGDLIVNSEVDARQKVLEEIQTGVDLIKISLEDGYAGKSGLPKLSQTEIDTIIVAAHEINLRVSGHVTQARYLNILVDSGIDDIAHLAYDPISPDVLQKMVDQGIYLVPTFTVFRNYGAPDYSLVTNLSNFVKLGGKVALGNDYGGGPKEFELGIPMIEIEMMSKSGMTPMQIIQASTSNAAHVVGLEDQIGTLESGKIADILIIDGNPLEDLQNLIRINTVIHNGVIIRSTD